MGSRWILLRTDKLFNDFLIFFSGYCYWTTKIRFSVIVLLSSNIFSNFCKYPLFHFFMETLYKLYLFHVIIFMTILSSFENPILTCVHIWKVVEMVRDSSDVRWWKLEKQCRLKMKSLQYSFFIPLWKYRACDSKTRSRVFYSIFLQKSFDVNSCTTWKYIGVF